MTSPAGYSVFNMTPKEKSNLKGNQGNWCATVLNFHSCIGYRHKLLSRSRAYFVPKGASSTYPVGKEQRRPILLLNLWHCLQFQHLYNVDSNTLCHIERTKDPVM
jgi:hypothetical protein